MKLRRNIVYALLSLLLVLSQQMGIMHAVSHISGYRHGTEQLQERDDASTSRGAALDHNCSQCLAFAQLASALDTPSFTFPAMEHKAPAVAVAKVPQACQRTVCVFHSRAPPQA
jgi:hypothetical protein